MNTLQIEALLRRGDPEDHAWVPPDFDLVRARAAVAAPRVRLGGRFIGAAPWLATAALGVLVLALISQGWASGPAAPGAASATSAAPTLPATDRATVARLMAVPVAGVLATEDGAVAVRRVDHQLQLLLATHGAAGWQVGVIGSQPDLSTPAAATVAEDAVACGDAGLVRSVFVYGQLVNQPVAETDLTLHPLSALGGALVNGLYVFALRGPVAPQTLIWITGQHGPPQLTARPWRFAAVPAGAWAAAQIQPATTCAIP